MSRERIVHEVGEWQNAVGQFILMPRKYPELAELAASVAGIRQLRKELANDPARKAALERRGFDGLREENAVVTREEIQDGLLAAGIITVAAQIEGTVMIGGVISALGKGDNLSVRTKDPAVAQRYELPNGKFSPIEDFLLNLAALKQSGQLPPMTDVEIQIQANIMENIKGLDSLNKRRRQLTQEGKKQFAVFSLESKGWRYLADGQTKFWLNPVERGVYEYGWYTLAELQQWLAGQGPVIKAPRR